MILLCNQTQDIPKALQYLAEYKNEKSANRLSRFHGQPTASMTDQQKQILHNFLEQY
jgi:hypothetical protein